MDGRSVDPHWMRREVPATAPEELSLPTLQPRGGPRAAAHCTYAVPTRRMSIALLRASGTLVTTSDSRAYPHCHPRVYLTLRLSRLLTRFNRHPSRAPKLSRRLLTRQPPGTHLKRNSSRLAPSPDLSVCNPPSLAGIGYSRSQIALHEHFLDWTGRLKALIRPRNEHPVNRCRRFTPQVIVDVNEQETPVMCLSGLRTCRQSCLSRTPLHECRFHTEPPLLLRPCRRAAEQPSARVVPPYESPSLRFRHQRFRETPTESKNFLFDHYPV